MKKSPGPKGVAREDEEQRVFVRLHFAYDPERLARVAAILHQIIGNDVHVEIDVPAARRNTTTAETIKARRSSKKRRRAHATK